jgi:signal transduction histidine kinase
MDFIPNSYSLVLLVSSLIVFGLSAFIVFRVDSTLRWIAYAMICFSVWGFFYGVELTALSLEEMLIWSKVQYIGLVSAPACWLIFTLKYTGFDDRKNAWIYPTVFALPAITYLVVLTNSWHGWHYKSTWLITDGPFPLLGIEKGPYYMVQVAYAYTYYVIGTWVLWKTFKSANLHFKTLTKLLIAAGFLPIFVNILYQLAWFKPFEGLDFTPYAFLFTYTLLGIAIIRFNFLNIKPIARDKILEVMTRGVLVFDHRNKLIDFNPIIKSYLSSEDKIFLGQDAELIFQVHPSLMNLLQSTNSSEQIKKSRIKSKDKVFDVELIRLLNDRSLVSGKLMLFDDITQQVEIQEKLENQAKELKQLNELKDKYFSIISHDLKGPVFGVKELIYLTNSGIISEKEFMEMLPEVSKNMEHVAILLENLLAWTSSQLKGEYLQLQFIDLQTVIKNQKNLLERIAKDKNIEIILNGEKEIHVKADKNMMELVFRNLISNAIKFSNPNSKVEISCSPDTEKIKISIRDYGVGIPEENLQKLNSGISFSTRGQSNESGTGLGMLMVKEYLMKNEGSLEIKSKLNEGSEFIVTLPLVQPE